MKIGIIGTGRVGAALKAGWAKAGHDVRIGGRSSHPGVADISLWADVLVLAVPYAAIKDVADEIAPAAGKIVIDCTNPIEMGPTGMELALGHHTSGGEVLKALLPEARVVKTLNQVGAEVMADATGFVQAPVQFVASDDAPAKRVVEGLLSDLGFDPLDAGDLSKARLLEPFALVWINQALARNKGRDWAFGAMPRGKSS